MQEDLEGDLLEFYQLRVKELGRIKSNGLLLWDVLLLFRPGIIRTFNIHPMSMLTTNLKIARRHMRKNPVFTAINTLGLAVGMCTVLLILVWVQNERSFDSYYPHAEELYRVICHWEGEGEQLSIPTIPIRLRDLAAREIPEIEDFFIMLPEMGNPPPIKIPTGEIFEEAALAYISDNWLAEFANKVSKGSIAAFQANTYGLALTEERARKFFGEADPIGKTVEVFSTLYTVELVLADPPSNSSFQQQVWLPLASYWADRMPYDKEIQSSNYKFIAFFRSPETIDPPQIESQLGDLMSQIDPNKPTSCSIFPLTGMRFQEGIQHDIFLHQNKATVEIFTLIGFVILLVAILNYINLSTATINRRIQEIGVRKVTGANFRHIFSQIVTESCLITFMGFAFALVGVYYLLPFLATYTDMDLQLHFSNRSIGILFLGVLLLSMLVSSVYPAYLYAGLKPIRLMVNERLAHKGVSLRKLLVISQFTTAIVVLICTFAIYRQLRFIQNKDVGYNRSQVISLKLKYTPGDDYAKNLDRFNLLKTELERVPEIESLAITDGELNHIVNRNSGSLDWEGKAQDQSIIVSQLQADEELLSVFQLKMAHGRWFLPENTSDKNNIILNETAIKAFNIPEPVIGRASHFQGREGQIIGVVKDFIFTDFNQAVSPLVIWHNGGRGTNLLARLQAGKVDQTLGQVEVAFVRLFPDKPFEYTFMDDSFRQLHRAYAQAGFLLNMFTGIILFISCLGLFGLTVFDAQRRSKEMAIRKVLGAGIPHVLKQLSGQYLLLIGFAFFVALPISFVFIQQWLQNFAFRIEISWWTFAIPGVAVLLVALFAMSFQGLRVALANPADSLQA